MSNIILIEDCIREFSDSNELEGYGADQQFEFFCALQLTKESDTSFTEIENSIVDGGSDGGVDVFIILVNDRNIYSKEQLNDIKVTDNSEVHIHLIQSKTSTSFSESTLDKLYISLPVFFDLAIGENELLKRFNSSLVEKIQIFREIWRLAARKKANVSIDICYCCKAENIAINSAFKLKKDQIVALMSEKIVGAEIHFSLYSSRELLDLYQKKPILKLELKFLEAPTPISFTQEKYGYIGAVTLSEYVNFISSPDGKIIENIFENNIRHFLGQVDVNKNIGITIKDDRENDFWWFNNGITVIASECRPFQKSLFLEGVQIINGLQTSFTIFEHKSDIEESDRRAVLIKVILTSDKKVIDKVIHSSNFQNPVPPVLLRATDPTQRDIEMFCLAKGYFYDRRKGYYKSQNKPANRIFNIQDMAQAIEAILFFNPSTARKNPTTIIKTDKSYTKVFDPQKDFNAFLNCVLIVRKVKKYIGTGIPAEDRGLARNIAYHISRVLSSALTFKPKYTSTDIAHLNVNDIQDADLLWAYKAVSVNLETYRTKSHENLINIAKSKKFDDFLTESLAKHDLLTSASSGPGGKRGVFSL